MIPYDAPQAIGQAPLVLTAQIVRTALLLHARGWQLALERGGFDSRSPERLLAGHLKTGMVQAARERGIATIIVEAVGTRSGDDVEEADGEADIAIWFHQTFDHNDPHLINECKRIAAGDADLVRKYIVEGLDRFIRRHYRPGENGCFMTGFVIDGDVDAIAPRINAYLDRVTRPGCRLGADPADPDLGAVFTSHHAVAGYPPLHAVKHCFFATPPGS